LSILRERTPDVLHLPTIEALAKTNIVFRNLLALERHRMTSREKIGQLFMVGFLGTS